MTVAKSTYELEDIRGFIIKRQWLIGPDTGHEIKDTLIHDRYIWFQRGHHLVTPGEYEELKAREDAGLGPERIRHIRSFIKGYLAAR